MADKRIHKLDSATITGNYKIPVDEATLNQTQQITIAELLAYLFATSIDYATGSTYTWPLAADYTSTPFTLKCTYAGTCTVTLQGSETLDGGTTFELIENESVTAFSNGTNWLLI